MIIIVAVGRFSIRIQMIVYVLINHTHSRIPILMFNRTFSSFALLHTHTNSFFRRHRHTVTNRSIVIVAFVAAASRLRFNGPVVYIDGFIMCIYDSWSGHTIPLRWPLFSWFNKLLLLSFFFRFRIIHIIQEKDTDRQRKLQQ